MQDDVPAPLGVAVWSSITVDRILEMINHSRLLWIWTEDCDHIHPPVAIQLRVRLQIGLCCSQHVFAFTACDGLFGVSIAG